jgi:multimeric flavodoxin WrbA
MVNQFVIIDGSHRVGNTELINNFITEQLTCHQLKLLNFKINHYNYDGIYNDDDDFITVINTLLKYDHIIFSTPMYWYAMSGILKVFLDRFTDLLKNHKDLGRELRGKSLMLVYNSNGNQEDYFEKPFENTANYLGMKYLGALHINMENESLDIKVKEKIKSFLSGISQRIL